MFETDKDLINNFHINSGHSVGSIKSYRSVFNKYYGFHNMSLSELLKEAIDEQESRIPENQLSIYDRIISFRNYMVENYLGNTIINSVSKIKTFYHYNRVHLPFIPPLNVKSIPKMRWLVLRICLVRMIWGFHWVLLMITWSCGLMWFCLLDWHALKPSQLLMGCFLDGRGIFIKRIFESDRYWQ